MDQAMGGLVALLFVAHYAFLFYSDSKLKRLTRHLDLPWYQYQKRVVWLKDNLDKHTGAELEDAHKALRSRSLALACAVAVVVIVVAALLVDR